MLSVDYDPRGEIMLENADKLLSMFPEHAQRAINSAMRSTGFLLRNALKDTIDRGGPTKAPWPGVVTEANAMTIATRKGGGWYKNWIWGYRPAKPGSRYKKRRAKLYGQFPLKNRRHWRTNPYSRFKGLLRYRLDEEDNLLYVGYVDTPFNVSGMLQKQAAGYTTPITPKMRKFAWAMGLPLSKTKRAFRTPARPLINPVWEEYRAAALRNLEEKFFGAIERYMTGGEKK